MYTSEGKKIVVTEKAPKAIGPYSHAICIEGFVFTAGQVGLDPVTMELVEGGIEAQTRQVLTNLSHVLEAADSGLYHSQAISDTAAAALRHNLLEYAELLLFLLAAMTYINAMEERHVFEALRGWLVRRSLSYRALFWAPGTLAFFVSPFADNVTTALIMCAVLMAVGGHSHRFITLGCINIVVAANAGGAFSPFGDITTLMVWQCGKVDFWTFFTLFVPSVVNYVVPAVLMTFALPSGTPHAVSDRTHMKRRRPRRS